jgi:hypothetical protein
MDITEIGIRAASALWQVLLVGLLLGAGLPALFALGVRFSGVGRDVGGESVTSSSPGTIAAGICFGLCALAVVAGVVVVAYGKQLLGG